MGQVGGDQPYGIGGSPQRRPVGWGFPTLVRRQKAALELRSSLQFGVRMPRLGILLQQWLRAFACSTGAFRRAVVQQLPSSTTTSAGVFPLPWLL